MPKFLVDNKQRPVARPPWYRDPAKRAIVIQLVLLGLTAWALITITDNTSTNLAQRGIKTGWAFMQDVATFPIPLNFSPFWEFTLGESKYWEIFVVGIQNTLLVGFLGIPAATLLGVAIGVMRLSPNYLIRSLTSIYIEIFRNTPLLLQLLFWAFAIFPPLFNLLPPVRDSFILGGTVINQSGIYLPAVIFDLFGITASLALLITMVAAVWGIIRYGKKSRDRTGRPFPTLLCSIGSIVVLCVAFYFLVGDHIAYEYPIKKGLNYRGGFRPPIQLIILWFGLVTYTAAFIAENVRGGILAVSHGQSEAGMALGLSRMQRMRLLILPQSMRIIIPPTISQYLNLVKNSSLAVAIGYPDITNIWAGIALNQTGQSLIILGLTVLVYECVSLSTSWLSNIYNKSVQIKE